MDSDTESDRIGIYPKRLRAQIIMSTTSEIKPLKNCKVKSKRAGRKKRRFLESDSKENWDTEPTPGCSKWSERSRSESESEEEELNSRPKRPKRQKLRFSRALKRLKAKRSGRNLSESECEDTGPSTSVSDGNRSEGSAQEDNVIFDIAYRHVDNTFKAKFPGDCRHPKCQKKIVPGQTQIIGVWFAHDLNQKKPAYICAEHYWYSTEREGQLKKDYEEQRTSDEDFIDDGDVNDEDDNDSVSTETDEVGEEGFTRNLQDILQDLRKEKPEDKHHKNLYINELSRYQLEIHNRRNKSIFTSETKRFRRHMRSARFDVGMKTKKN